MPKMRITVDLEPELLERVERLAEERGVSRNQIVAEALEARLAEEEWKMEPIYLVYVRARTEEAATREYPEADYSTFDYGDHILGFRRLADALAAAERYGGQVEEGWVVEGNFDATHPAADEFRWAAFDGPTGIYWPHADAAGLRALLARREEE